MKDLSEEQQKIIETIKRVAKEGALKRECLDNIQKIITMIENLNHFNDVKQICNVITKNEPVEVIENNLDKQIKKYNGFTEKNPMDYVSYDSSNELYVCRYNKTKITSKKCETICEKLIQKIIDNFPNQIEKIVYHFKKEIQYSGKYLIIYNDFVNPLFDIQHVLHLLELENTQLTEKYNEYKSHITHYCFKKNEFGGYICRELVTFKTMCDIVSSSNKPFATKFKSDINQIIDYLRRNGQLIITPTEITTPERTVINHDENTNNLALEIINEHQIVPSYNNSMYMEMIRKLVFNGSQIIVNPYINKHVMYLFLVTIHDETNKNQIICKIGYTEDIVARMKSLHVEYKCNFYLIALKYVYGRKTEEEFHTMIKTSHANLWIPKKIQKTDKYKDELYIFDIVLFQEFMSIKDTDVKKENCDIDELISGIVKNQYMYFLKHLESIRLHSIVDVFSLIPKTTEYNEVMIEYIKQNSKIYQLELEHLENESKRVLQLRMKELELELAKVKNNY